MLDSWSWTDGPRQPLLLTSVIWETAFDSPSPSAVPDLLQAGLHSFWRLRRHPHHQPGMCLNNSNPLPGNAAGECLPPFFFLLQGVIINTPFSLLFLSASPPPPPPGLKRAPHETECQVPIGSEFLQSRHPARPGRVLKPRVPPSRASLRKEPAVSAASSTPPCG